jgi:hypothetical protein
MISIRSSLPTLSLLVALLATHAHAATLTFDDLQGNLIRPVPNGYGGLNWTNFSYLDGVHNPSGGYTVAAVSPNNVAFNSEANPATMSITSNSPFDFLGAYFTAAWNDGLAVRVQGFSVTHTYDTTIFPSAVAPTFFNFNYTGINRLDFTSSGGTPHPAYADFGYGAHFALDNFTYTPISEPSTLLLIAFASLTTTRIPHRPQRRTARFSDQ